MGQCRSDGEPFKHNAKTAVFNLKEQECGLVALTSLRNETEGLGNSRNVAQNIKNKCSVKEKKKKKAQIRMTATLGQTTHSDLQIAKSILHDQYIQ